MCKKIHFTPHILKSIYANLISQSYSLQFLCLNTFSKYVLIYSTIVKVQLLHCLGRVITEAQVAHWCSQHCLVEEDEWFAEMVDIRQLAEVGKQFVGDDSRGIEPGSLFYQ